MKMLWMLVMWYLLSMDLISWVNVSRSNLLVDLVNQTPSLILAVPSLVPDVLPIECRYLDYRVILAGRI
jgi:hypothetical protein